MLDKIQIDFGSIRQRDLRGIHNPELYQQFLSIRRKAVHGDICFNIVLSCVGRACYRCPVCGHEWRPL